MNPYIVCFRFKFYPADPMLLKEEVTRKFTIIIRVLGKFCSKFQLNIFFMKGFYFKPLEDKPK